MECEGELWCRSGSDGMCEVRVLAVEVRVVVLAALRVGECRLGCGSWPSRCHWVTVWCCRGCTKLELWLVVRMGRGGEM